MLLDDRPNVPRAAPLWSVNDEREVDHRRAARYATSFRVLARKLSDNESYADDAVEVVAELRDISRGGCCLVSEQGWNPLSVLRCEILLPQLAVGVPTLAQVRWLGSKRQNQFVMGLRFLIE